MKAVEPKPKLTSLLNLNRHISSTGSIQYALKLATTQEVKCSDDSSSGAEAATATRRVSLRYLLSSKNNLATSL